MAPNLVVPENLIPEGFESAEATLSYLIAEKCLLYADEFLAERVEAIGLFGASLTCVESCMSGGCHEMSLGFLEEIPDTRALVRYVQQYEHD